MGLLFDDAGNKMSPSHSSKKGKKYRYYITCKNKVENIGKITKLPAGEIEDFVKDQLIKLLKNKKFIQKYLINENIEIQTEILKLAETLDLDKLFIRNAVNRIDLQLDEIKITYDTNYIMQYLLAKVSNKELPISSEVKLLEALIYNVKISLTPSKKNKIIIQGKNNYDLKLINAIVQSFWFNEKCAKSELTRAERLNGNNKRYKNLRFLPPNIIEDIFNGKNDPNLTIQDLLKMVG